MEFPEIEAPGIIAHMKGSVARTLGIAPVRNHYTPRGRAVEQPGEGIFSVNATQRKLLKGCIIIWRT
jgi:hypothetical protein